MADFLGAAIVPLDWLLTAYRGPEVSGLSCFAGCSTGKPPATEEGTR